MIDLSGVCTVQVGEEVAVRKDIVVRPFATCHTIPSQGYVVVSKKRKLKQEYVGAGKDAIINAKKEGIEINDVAEVTPSVFVCLSALRSLLSLWFL